MKRLIFVRHGRAEVPDPEISDFERSLTLKGKSISKLMAMRLREEVNFPGNLITSPAFRALETAIIFAIEFDIQPEKIILNSNLYYKMNFRYLSDLLSMVSEDHETITFFGHNPSFTEIAGSLCKGGCDFIPKCGIVSISFNIKTWADIRPGSGKMDFFLKPEKSL